MIVYHNDFDVYEVLDRKKHLATEESYVKARTLDLIVREPQKIGEDYQLAVKENENDY